MDNVIDLRFVAFKSRPTQNIVAEVIAGRARYTETLQPYGADSIAYTLLLAPLAPGNYEYVAVAQQFGPNLLADWRVVGLYHGSEPPGTPAAVFVPANTIVHDINIHVDFSNPLPFP